MQPDARVPLWLSRGAIALAVLLGALWTLSMFRAHIAYAYTDVLDPAQMYTSHQRGVASTGGRLWFAYVRAESLDESARHPKRLRTKYMSAPRDEGDTSRYHAADWLALLGIDGRWKDNSSLKANGHYVYHELFFSIPYWLLIAAAGGAGWWVGRRPRLLRRRMRRGLCLACGYDVRATPGRCPECGYEPAAVAAREAAHAR